MTPQELRNSILQRAMEGKLVEQRPEEGTGKDLYELIQEEKNRLVKEGKIKKQKALSEIKEDEIPFEIPESWKWCKLGVIINFNIGKTPPRAEPEWWGNDVPWVSISDMIDYGCINYTKEKVTDSAINTKFQKLIKKDTLLMSFKLTVGRTSILGVDAVHNEAIISIDTFIDKNHCFRNYLFYLLPLIASTGESKKAIKGKTLNTSSINNLLVPLPPLEELERIVERIKQLLPLVDEYEKNWQKLEDLNKKFPEDMKKSLLQGAIKGKLVEQRPEEGTGEDLYKHIQEEKNKLIQEGKIKKQKALPEIKEDEIPFEIPVSWKWVRLHEIVYNHGQEKPKVKFSYIDIGSVDNKKNKLNLNENILDYEGAPSRARKIVKKGDIIYSTVRPYLHNICIIDRTFLHKPIASTGFAVLSCYNGVYNKFLFYYLLSPIFDEYVNNNENSKGVAYPAINDRQLYKGLIPLPPLQEQERIVEKLEELLPLCDQLVQKQ